MKPGGKIWTARRIHLWISIALAIPMGLMAVSGILIAMRSVSHVTVPLSWLGAETTPERLPINAYAEATDGSVWIGNAQGLYRVAGKQAEPVPHFVGQEVVAVAFRSGGAVPVVATRMAVWEQQAGQWTAARRGRVRQLSTLPDGRLLTIAGGRGELADGKPFVSAQAGEWQPFADALKANGRLPRLENPRAPLHQVMRELHSGAFFFGKGPGEMVWSNILGWILMTLVLTGIWMWLRAERVKARKRVAKTAGEGHRAHAPAPAPVAAGEG